MGYWSHMEQPSTPPASAPDPIAKAIQQEAHRRGLTTCFIAEIAGVDRGALSRWFSGKRSVSAATAGKVLEALGMEITPGSESHAHTRER